MGFYGILSYVNMLDIQNSVLTSDSVMSEDAQIPHISSHELLTDVLERWDVKKKKE